MHSNGYRDGKERGGLGFNVENGRDLASTADTYTSNTTANEHIVFQSSPDSELFVIPIQRQPTTRGPFSEGVRRLFHRLRNPTTSEGSSRSVHRHHALSEKKARDHLGYPSRRWRPMGMYKSIALLIVAAFIFSHTYFGYLPESLSGSASSDPSFSNKQFGHGSPRRPLPRKGGWDNREQKHPLGNDVKEATISTGRHESKSGLLKVDLSLPVSRHPIKQLIREAQTKWAAKNAKQSKTLKQAVEEYKRRHRGNLPPKGFDKWWKFVKSVPSICYAIFLKEF